MRKNQTEDPALTRRKQPVSLIRSKDLVIKYEKVREEKELLIQEKRLMDNKNKGLNSRVTVLSKEIKSYKTEASKISESFKIKSEHDDRYIFILKKKITKLKEENSKLKRDREIDNQIISNQKNMKHSMKSNTDSIKIFPSLELSKIASNPLKEDYIKKITFLENRIKDLESKNESLS